MGLNTNGFAPNGKNIGEATRSPKDDLDEEIEREFFAQPSDLMVAKKILISGEESRGKTSLSLRLFSNILKDDECVVYLNLDDSGSSIIDSLYKKEKDNRNIIEMSVSKNKTKDDITYQDPELTLEKAKRTMNMLKKVKDGEYDEEHGKQKDIVGVIIDGISVVLKTCEDYMRLEKDLDPSSGVMQQYWKIRAREFRQTMSSFTKTLRIPVMLISHEDFIPDFLSADKLKDFPAIKKEFLNLMDTRIILTRETSEKNDKVDNYIATVMKNRSDINYQDRSFVFMRRHKKDNEDDEIIVETDELTKMLFPDRFRSNDEK